MKQLAILISVIVMMFCTAYIFVLPKVLFTALNTEVSKAGFEISQKGNVHINLNSFKVSGLKLTNNAVAFDVPEIQFDSSPLILLITKQAKKVIFKTPNIYIDLTSNKPLIKYSKTFVKAPHTALRNITNNNIKKLTHLSDNIKIDALTIDLYTDQGLISIKGDAVLDHGKLLANFASVQKQMTLHLNLSGQVAEQTQIKASIKNLNYNTENLAIKRGQADVAFLINKSNKASLNMKALAGLVNFNGLSFNKIEAQSKAKNDRHEFYIKGYHSNESYDSAELWHKFAGNNHTSHLQINNIEASKVFSAYNKGHKNKQRTASLIQNLFIYPTDITVTSSYTKELNAHNVMIMPQFDSALFNTSIRDNAETFNMQVNDFQLNATQAKALSKFITGANIFHFEGAARLDGTLNLTKKDLSFTNQVSSIAPLTLFLKNVSFKSDSTTAQGINGQIIFSSDKKSNSVLKLAHLSNNGFKLKNTRINFNVPQGISKVQNINVTGLRSNIGAGNINITQKKNHYVINARRVNIDALPQSFLPTNRTLEDLVNIDGRLDIRDKKNNLATLKLNYHEIVRDKKATFQKSYEQPKENDYLKYLMP